MNTDGYAARRGPRFEQVWDEDDWFRRLMELGVPASRATAWAPAFADEVQPARFSQGLDDVIAWLAQVLHETDMLRLLKENLNYSAKRIAEVWPSRFQDVTDALPYAHAPDKLAERAYGGRMGNTMPGDGFRFIGRGLIMVTGRASYRRLGAVMGQDLEDNPELLEQPRYAIEAAVYWWESNVDDLFLSDQVKVRKRVNGGVIGLEHCLALHQLASKVMA